MNIIVTGASQGIGYEISKIFAAGPENTVLAISRNENKLNKLRSECLAINPDSGLTECLSSEYANSGIYFNCLALGSVKTDMFAKAFPCVKARFTPEMMAEYIVDFAVNGYKYNRGKILPVSVSVP